MENSPPTQPWGTEEVDPREAGELSRVLSRLTSRRKGLEEGGVEDPLSLLSQSTLVCSPRKAASIGSGR